MGRAGRGIPIASAGVPETTATCCVYAHFLKAPYCSEYLAFKDLISLTSVVGLGGHAVRHAFVELGLHVLPQLIVLVRLAVELGLK